MKRIFGMATAIALATMLIGACAEREEQQKSMAELSLEIDQLTNAVGRLEFRVAQLEDRMGATELGEAPATSPADAAETAAPSPETDDAESGSSKRYDLAPVE